MVWTGGYSWTRDGHKLVSEDVDDVGYISLREKAMCQKSEYINGQREDKEYLKFFEEAGEALERVGIAPVANRDVELVRTLDVEKIKNRRRSNAAVLRSIFPEWLIFTEISTNDTPMFVPVLVPDGKCNELRHYLIEHDIYCPVHWSVSEYHKLDDRTASIYDNELSLVCDQRYTEADMYRMIDTIEQFWKEG